MKKSTDTPHVCIGLLFYRQVFFFAIGKKSTLFKAVILIFFADSFLPSHNTLKFSDAVFEIESYNFVLAHSDFINNKRNILTRKFLLF